MDIKEYIRDIPNFPKDGILYKDITPLLGDYKAFTFVVNEISRNIPKEVTSIVAPESRGFIFASAVCYNLNKNLVLVRKKGKLPGAVYKKKYKLEYGFDQVELQKNSILKKDKILIVDDLIATGGTAIAAAKLVENMSLKDISFMFVIDLYNLNGAAVLANKGYKVFSIMRAEG